MEDKRIYVVVLSAVKTTKKVVKIPCGMACAQSAHAVSKLRLNYVAAGKNAHERNERLAAINVPITTIVLRCRDYAELQHVGVLAELKKIPTARFEDDNESLYGDGGKYSTAMAFGPCKKDDVFHVLDYLPLWTCEPGCKCKG